MTGPWTFAVGELPYRVTAFENLARHGVLYLRWRALDEAGRRNWRVESLQKALRTANGRILKTVEAWAQARAEAKYQELLGALPPSARPLAVLTLEQGLALACDPDTGKYPADSLHRREVIRELHHAARLLGDVSFNGLRKGDLLKLGRRRREELVARHAVGVRGAEITVSRLLALAEWLRGEGRIDEAACRGWSNWKAELRKEAGEPEPFRPRHTLTEARAILAVAWDVDPRLGLALALGAELRGGQVVRTRRSDLDLAASTVQVRGRGKKRGTIVHLTPGQRAAVARAFAGYLAPLEATTLDYPLFPQGKLAGWKAEGGRTIETTKGRRRVGHRLVPAGAPTTTRAHADAKPLHPSTLDQWFREAEALAGVPHVRGRAWYGLRRVFVDAAADAGISAEGLQEHGGWADSQVPEQIYRAKDRVKARKEAAKIRAKTRGEGKP